MYTHLTNLFLSNRSLFWASKKDLFHFFLYFSTLSLTNFKFSSMFTCLYIKHHEFILLPLFPITPRLSVAYHFLNLQLLSPNNEKLSQTIYHEFLYSFNLHRVPCFELCSLDFCAVSSTYQLIFLVRNLVKMPW